MFLLTLVLALTVLPGSVALAAGGSTCPPGFTLEMHMHHEDHEHVHVGTSADQNSVNSVVLMNTTLLLSKLFKYERCGVFMLTFIYCSGLCDIGSISLIAVA